MTTAPRLLCRPRFGVVRATPHAGRRFRSRLEARWSVFFDELGLAWEYEPERVHLPSGRTYTPDFRISGGLWIEVKGPDPIAEEIEKAEGLAVATSAPVALAIGDPFFGDIGVYDAGRWHPARWGIANGGAVLDWLNCTTHSPSLRRAATAARQAYFR